LEPIWNHEVTHQLFQECGDSVPDPGEMANVWILEGMAVYIESLVRHRGYCTVGGFEADRLQFARRAKLKGEFYLPLTQLVRLGREDLQKHPELARVYTQSAGLTHFLMNSRGGEFRNALTRYLLHVYRGSDDPDALAQAIGAPLADLDARYAEFLKVADEDLRNVQRVSPLYHLSLTGTSVTDAGLASLASTHLEQLQWLDLSFTKAGDPALLAFANAKKLKQAFLEATSITDRGLAALGSWPELEELDLSRTAITDEGLVHLEPLKKLRTLWLTGTQITDAAIPYLRRHVDLEWLDVGGTRISEGGLRQLRAALLKLRERTGAAKP
jgi:hypothetical protein